MREDVISASQKQTQKIGEDFAARLDLTTRSNLNQAEVVALYGDLGSGKTTFVQGFAKGLGIIKRLISPTFTIIRTYKVNLKSLRQRRIRLGRKNLKIFYHIDLYRIEFEKDLESLGIKEILDNPENIVAIEWAEKMGELLPKNRWDLRFEYIDENKRKITIAKNSNTKIPACQSLALAGRRNPNPRIENSF